MRPRSGDRGNHLYGGSSRDYLNSFNEAAIRGSRKSEVVRRTDVVEPPSMRPRSGDRGNAETLGGAPRSSPPSMRPRSGDRGNVAHVVWERFGEVPLQ